MEFDGGMPAPLRAAAAAISWLFAPPCGAHELAIVSRCYSPCAPAGAATPPRLARDLGCAPAPPCAAVQPRSKLPRGRRRRGRAGRGVRGVVCAGAAGWPPRQRVRVLRRVARAGARLRVGALRAPGGRAAAHALRRMRRRGVLQRGVCGGRLAGAQGGVPGHAGNTGGRVMGISEGSADISKGQRSLATQTFSASKLSAQNFFFFFFAAAAGATASSAGAAVCAHNAVLQLDA